MQYQEQERHSSFGAMARRNFVKKVYSVMTCQLMVTVLMVWANYTFKAFARFQAYQTWCFWLAFITTIVSLFALFLGKFTRSFPANYIVLGIFTLAESYLVSTVCSMYTAQSVLLSAVATLSASLGLTYHALTTKEDYTSYRSSAKGLIYSLSWAALSISLINLFFLRSSLVTCGLAFIFTIIYSVYLIVDTQMIMGGKRKQVGLDDYILGSVIIYTDIISLFLKILQILGKKKDD